MAVSGELMPTPGDRVGSDRRVSEVEVSFDLLLRSSASRWVTLSQADDVSRLAQAGMLLCARSALPDAPEGGATSTLRSTSFLARKRAAWRSAAHLDPVPCVLEELDPGRIRPSSSDRGGQLPAHECPLGVRHQDGGSSVNTCKGRHCDARPVRIVRILRSDLVVVVHVLQRHQATSQGSFGRCPSSENWARPWP